MPERKSDKKFDARGMQCPIPILQAKKLIDKMNTGEILEVLSDDPGSKEDFIRWAKRTGNNLLDTIQEEGYYKFLIKKTN